MTQPCGGNRQARNLEQRLTDFWAANPNAGMTVTRVCIDFGVSLHYARDTLRRMHYGGKAQALRLYVPSSSATPAPGETEVRL